MLDDHNDDSDDALVLVASVIVYFVGAIQRGARLVEVRSFK